MAHTKRLYKSSQDKVLSGVGGGMAEYFGIDPVFVRLGWVASIFVTGGLSIIAYIVMVIIVPRSEHAAPSGSWVAVGESPRDSVETEASAGERSERRRYLLGICLIVAGIALLIYNMDFFDWFAWINLGIIAAVFIMGVGAAIIYASVRQRQ